MKLEAIILPSLISHFASCAYRFTVNNRFRYPTDALVLAKLQRLKMYVADSDICSRSSLSSSYANRLSRKAFSVSVHKAKYLHVHQVLCHITYLLTDCIFNAELSYSSSYSSDISGLVMNPIVTLTLQSRDRFVLVAISITSPPQQKVICYCQKNKGWDNPRTQKGYQGRMW